MWKAFWIAAAASVCSLVAIVWISASATFLYRHPYNKDARIVVDSTTGGAVLVGFHRPDGTVEPALGNPAGGSPRVEVREREFDFGTMNPLTMGRHDFVVRNVGRAPLKLRVGPTTCKCTLSGLEKSEIAPGEQTSVRLEWNSGRDYRYEHSGTIYTNDPQQRSIELRIRGRVIAQFAADVNEIVVPPLKPDAPATTDVLVYSQLWDEIDLTKIECTLPGVSFDVQPFDPEASAELNATAVRCLRLSIPSDLPAGDFTGVVRLAATGPDGREHRLELPLHGSVLPRMDLVGGDVDPFGNIDLGSIPAGTGKRVRLLVKVYDRQPLLDRAEVTTFPAFLKATLRPHAGAEASGLFDLVLEVPAGTPVCQYLGHPRAEVRIATGHERLGDVKLGATFVVLPRRPL